MFAVADYDFFDFLEGPGIDADAAGGNGIAAVSAVFCKFEGLAIFEQENFAGNAAELIRECSVAEEMAVFTVNGNEVLRLHQLEDEFLLFLAGMTGYVNGATGIVVIDEGTTAEHVVEHAEDGFFVSGDDAGGEDDAVVFVDRDEAVIVDRDGGGQI